MVYAASVARWLPAALLTVGLLAACDRIQPIYQVDNHPVPQLSRPMTLEQIEASIIRAGKSVNWQIRPLESGKLLGRTSWRRHSAVVSIEFDQRFFSIRYRSSDNLLAGVATEEEPYSGQKVIHREYNRRVRMLESAIDNELAFPSPS